jgi:hypothetical protein
MADVTKLESPELNSARAHLLRAALHLVSVALADADAEAGLIRMLESGAGELVVTLEVSSGRVTVDLDRGAHRQRLLTSEEFDAGRLT